MQRKFKLIVLLAVIALLLTGCSDQGASSGGLSYIEEVEPLTDPIYTNREAVYELYEQVNIGDTMDEIVARFGEPALVEEDDYGATYTWKNENGYGFVGVFFEDGRLRSKTVFFNDMRQLKELSGATTLEKFTMLETKHDFTMVCLALGGKPCEIAAIAQDSSTEPEIYRLFAWLDEYGSNVQVLFNTKEKIVEVRYSLADRTMQ